ncbi:hypothetical protein F506_11320 [Herbaspirillum hiltneri N3]|uniref:Lipoprotein n=1 Tax=Herbaspirillum hiltneri N3 TaxID=1262470 RepID=A0ABM5V0Z6_9BURK|nr:hypothetical protein [Herbaspirillum hiltneri]AKZ63181.1 hypothetical protein F506_11320 [Herbaspirillum hiltneri N3]
MHPSVISRAATLLASWLAACVLGGCANFSEVVSVDGGDNYNLTATGISYTMSMSRLTNASREKAVAWCAVQGRDMQLRQQARSWQPLQVELDFRCLPREAGTSESGLNALSLTRLQMITKN